MSVDTFIRQALSSVTETGSQNRLAVPEIRDWLVELLDDHAAACGGNRAELHRRVLWDLIADDGDPTHDAVFAAVCFAGDRVTFLAGRGAPDDLHGLGGGERPEDPGPLFEALKRRFAATSPLVLDRRQVEAWLA